MFRISILILLTTILLQASLAQKKEILIGPWTPPPAPIVILWDGVQIENSKPLDGHEIFSAKLYSKKDKQELAPYALHYGNDAYNGVADITSKQAQALLYFTEWGHINPRCTRAIARDSFSYTDYEYYINDSITPFTHAFANKLNNKTISKIKLKKSKKIKHQLYLYTQQ